MPTDQDNHGNPPPGAVNDAGNPAPGVGARGVERVLGFLPLAMAALFAARLPLLPRRSLDPDELEHAHAAWSLFRGMLPYRDFFEHHTPWYYYVLRPFFNWFDVDTSFQSATRFLVLGRALSLLFTIVSAALVFWLGRLWRDRRTGLVAALLFLGQPFIFQKTLEMRPDVLALPFFLGALGLTAAGIQRDAPSLRHFLSAGFSLGAAIMCTQKMLFVLPGLGGGLGLWWLYAKTNGGLRRRTAALVAFVLGIGVPIALTWAAFAWRHGASEFVTNNFLLNAKWKHFTTNKGFKLIETSGPVLALALVGGWVFASGFRRDARRNGRGDYAGVVLICTALALFLGLVVMPVPHRQYYLMPLPIVCLFAVDGLFRLVDRAPERARPRALAVTLLVLSVLPVAAVCDAYRDRNDAQLAKLRTVFETTKPTDVVMDGWEGMGVFRPHAFYYYFLHEEAVAMLPPAKLDAYLDALESGRIRPKLIAMDKNLWTLGPRFTRFVRERYTTRDGFFYYANAAN
jgi:4-amino-4-deoxy-L-arabinose transferase-like glycosyltransferase